ncbi:MAG: hypothetical protein Q4P15_02240 [Propionibacteriaceae bacterium]|nr:hypothetical protein [Propionibacteriaceae bacterium]
MTNSPNAQTRAPRTFGWSSVITIVGTIVLAALMLLLIQVPTFQQQIPLVVLGTAMIALGFGGRVVMLVGRLKASTEAVVIGLCYSIVVLGTLCFEPLSTRIIVAGVALLILLLIDAIDSRLLTSRND